MLSLPKREDAKIKDRDWRDLKLTKKIRSNKAVREGKDGTLIKREQKKMKMMMMALEIEGEMIDVIIVTIEKGHFALDCPYDRGGGNIGTSDEVKVQSEDTCIGGIVEIPNFSTIEESKWSDKAIVVID